MPVTVKKIVLWRTESATFFLGTCDPVGVARGIAAVSLALGAAIPLRGTEEQATDHRIASTGQCDLQLDVPRQIPHQILPALETRDRARIQPRVAYPIQHVDPLRPRSTGIPIQTVQRYLVGVPIRQIHVHAHVRGRIPYRCDAIRGRELLQPPNVRGG